MKVKETVRMKDETLDVDYDISVRIDEAHENSTSFKKMSIP